MCKMKSFSIKTWSKTDVQARKCGDQNRYIKNTQKLYLVIRIQLLTKLKITQMNLKKEDVKYKIKTIFITVKNLLQKNQPFI